MTPSPSEYYAVAYPEYKMFCDQNPRTSSHEVDPRADTSWVDPRRALCYHCGEPVVWMHGGMWTAEFHVIDEEPV